MAKSKSNGLNTSGPITPTIKQAKPPAWKVVAGSAAEARLEPGKITQRLMP